jgi:hypothetical protein
VNEIRKVEIYTRKQILKALRQIFKNRNEKAYFFDIKLNSKFVTWFIVVYPFKGDKRQCEITFFDKPVDENTHQRVAITDIADGSVHTCNAEVIIHTSTFREPPPDSKGVG